MITVAGAVVVGDVDELESAEAVEVSAVEAEPVISVVEVGAEGGDADGSVMVEDDPSVSEGSGSASEESEPLLDTMVDESVTSRAAVVFRVATPFAVVSTFAIT